MIFLKDSERVCEMQLKAITTSTNSATTNSKKSKNQEIILNDDSNENGNLEENIREKDHILDLKTKEIIDLKRERDYYKI